MESVGSVYDELQLAAAKKGKFEKRMTRRKEELYYSALLFARRNSKLKPKRTLITNKAIYFLKTGCCSKIGSSVGITFAQKWEIFEIIEITVDWNRFCLLIHMNKKDDLFLQVVDFPDEKLETMDFNIMPVKEDRASVVNPRVSTETESLVRNSTMYQVKNYREKYSESYF